MKSKCPICGKLKANMLGHFQKKHPGEKIPKSPCPKCDRQVANVSGHLEKVHAEGVSRCDTTLEQWECGCNPYRRPRHCCSMRSRCPGCGKPSGKQPGRKCRELVRRVRVKT